MRAVDAVRRVLKKNHKKEDYSIVVPLELIRRALGARRSDIVLQFLMETLILSISGGVIGLVVGALIPLVITATTSVKTVLTFPAFAVAFTVSVTVSVVFGIYPARRAAMMDPIDALRHE